MWELLLLQFPLLSPAPCHASFVPALPGVLAGPYTHHAVSCLCIHARAVCWLSWIPCLFVWFLWSFPIFLSPQQINHFLLLLPLCSCTGPATVVLWTYFVVLILYNKLFVHLSVFPLKQWSSWKQLIFAFSVLY